MVRPSSLEEYDIIQKCMYKYWEKGINYFSFNLGNNSTKLQGL